AHLADCPDCARAVRDQERLDALLAEAVDRLDPVPAGLAERIRRRRRLARRRRVAAAAAVLAVAAGVAWLLMPTDRPPTPLASVQPAADAPQPAERVRVTFPAGSNVIAVPVPAESPNVTVIWVYPGL